MNDFTKDELESMLLNLGTARWYLGIEDWEQNLHDKLQSMIDNYCEHENLVNIGGWVSKCTKCGMKWVDDTQ